MNVKAVSHIGRGMRQINEDAYYVSSKERGYPYLLAVADGMGGHQAGDVASRLALEAVTHYLGYEIPRRDADNVLTIGLLPALPLDQMDETMSQEDQLFEAMDWVNTVLYNASLRKIDLRGMGTTLTLALIDRDQAWVAHVGDSRLYQYRTGELKQITEDHSLVAEMTRDGLITEAQALVHPRRNVLTRSIGTSSFVESDVYILDIRAGDRLLLCSDGLAGYISHQSMLRAMANPPEISTQRLLDLALGSTGTDNITFIVYEHEG